MHAVGLADDVPADLPAAAHSDGKIKIEWQGVPHFLSPPDICGFCFEGFRRVIRIQRGSPVNSVHITCYQHYGCSLTLPLWNCPTDEVLMRWAYELEPSKDTDTKAERKTQKTKHKKNATDRWSAAAYYAAFAKAATAAVAAADAPK